MTINELIAVLEAARAEHGNVLVVLSSDGEGNDFSPPDANYAPGVWELGEFGDVDDDEEASPVNCIAVYPL